MNFILNNRARITALCAAALIAALDVLSKEAMKDFLQTKPDRESTLIKGFLNVVYRHNTGGAFSLLDNYPKLFLYLPALLIVVVLGLLLVTRQEPRRYLDLAGLGMILGGASGNMIDRLRFGKVFDFIDCHLGAVHWPSFNLADSCIVVGVCLFALALLRSDGDHGG